MLSTRSRGCEFPTQPTPTVIGALICVHRALGPGLLESAYEACVCRELEFDGLSFERQVPVPLVYRGRDVGNAYRMDILVNGQILIEVKAVDALLPIHSAQVITYLKLARVPVGLLVNFNVPSLRQGIRRLYLPPPF